MIYTHCITGIHATEIMTNTKTAIFPTTSCSSSTERRLLVFHACLLKYAHMSIVKIEDPELNIDVKLETNAASITASIKPFNPE